MRRGKKDQISDLRPLSTLMYPKKKIKKLLLRKLCLRNTCWLKRGSQKVKVLFPELIGYPFSIPISKLL